MGGTARERRYPRRSDGAFPGCAGAPLGRAPQSRHAGRGRPLAVVSGPPDLAAASVRAGWPAPFGWRG